MVHSGVLYIFTLYFWKTAGPPNVVGPGVANPLPHFLDGYERRLGGWRHLTQFQNTEFLLLKYFFQIVVVKKHFTRIH